MPEATDNPAHQRYEMMVDGETAFVSYGWRGDRLVLRHAEVPTQLEGRGVGSALVRSVLDDIRRRGVRVVPQCSFVAAFIRRHPDYADMVAD